MDLMSAMGQKSLTRIALPRALEAKELKYILCCVHFWCSVSICREVRVSKRTAKLVRALFILLCSFCLLELSEKLWTFQKVTVMLSSEDFGVYFGSSTIRFS